MKLICDCLSTALSTVQNRLSREGASSGDQSLLTILLICFPNLVVLLVQLLVSGDTRQAREAFGGESLEPLLALIAARQLMECK